MDERWFGSEFQIFGATDENDLSRMPAPTRQSINPPLILCFYVNRSPLIVNTFSTLSFRSACRITILLVLLDKGVKTINQPIQMMSGYRQRILNKSHEKPRFSIVAEF